MDFRLRPDLVWSFLDHKSDEGQSRGSQTCIDSAALEISSVNLHCFDERSFIIADQRVSLQNYTSVSHPGKYCGTLVLLGVSGVCGLNAASAEL